jgi:hypothetical protein
LRLGRGREEARQAAPAPAPGDELSDGEQERLAHADDEDEEPAPAPASALAPGGAAAPQPLGAEGAAAPAAQAAGVAGAPPGPPAAAPRKRKPREPKGGFMGKPKARPAAPPCGAAVRRRMHPCYAPGVRHGRQPSLCVVPLLRALFLRPTGRSRHSPTRAARARQVSMDREKLKRSMERKRLFSEAEDEAMLRAWLRCAPHRVRVGAPLYGYDLSGWSTDPTLSLRPARWDPLTDAWGRHVLRWRPRLRCLWRSNLVQGRSWGVRGGPGF